MSREASMEKARQFGASEAQVFSVFSLGAGALMFFVLSQIGGLIAGVLAAAAVFVALQGREAMSGFTRLAKGLFIHSDTRDRVLAMEEYHGIEYVEIPGERMYLKQGEHADLVIYGRNGKVRTRRTVSGT